MAKHLYRKIALGVILLALVVPVFSQGRSKQRTGPRSVGVLEVDTQNHARLVPVTLIYNGRFYDGSLYEANPVPMALLPQTVYDVLQTNDRAGTFITGGSRESGKAWFGLGTWKGKEEEAKAKATTSDEDQERPILRRSKAAAEPTPFPAASKAESAKAAAPTPTPAPEEDTNRPTLKHTRAGENPTAATKAAEQEMLKPIRSVAAPATIQPLAKKVKEYVAISDAEASEYRPMTYPLKPDDEAGYLRKMLPLAEKELRAYAASHAIKVSAAFEITDHAMRAFDADYSNNPQLVLTYSYTPPTATGSKPAVLYGTLVARADYNGDPQKLFAQTTDSTRLDVTTRLELVDMVDAEGYQRGSLLFRQYSDIGRSFVLYRVETYGLTKLFEGGSGE